MTPRSTLFLTGLLGLAAFSPLQVKAAADYIHTDATHTVVQGEWFVGETDAARSALTFLQGEGKQYGLVDPARTTLKVERITETPVGTRVLLRHYVGKLPVLDGYTGVLVREDGAIRSAWSANTQAQGGSPRLSAEQALSIANSHAGIVEKSLLTPKIELGAGPTGPTWRVEIPAALPAGVWRVEVDARTGKPLGRPLDVARYATDGKGQIFYVNAAVALERNDLKDVNDSDSSVPSDAYIMADLLELNGTGYVVGPYADCKAAIPKPWRPYNANNQFIYTRNPNQFEAIQAYWSLDYAQRYIQGVGFTNVNNRQLRVAVNTYPADNSFYSAGSITLGSGGVDDGEDSEVIWHEMGHAIQDDQVPGYGASHEAGSMGEGFGDYIAASIGSRFSNGWQDECVAEWDAVSYSSDNPPCLRRVDGDKIYPDDMEGEVHADGEIWSAALWDARDILGNDRGVSHTLTAHFYLSPNATFEQAAQAYLMAAEDLNDSQAEIDALRQVFVDRGIL